MSTRKLDDSGFRMMAFGFKIRDFFSPRRKVVKETRLKPGDVVLDFGCGPGSYVVPTVERIGEEGTYYALDEHPKAMEAIRDLVRKKGLTKVRTIQTSCSTGLEDRSVDVIYMYDVFHHLERPIEVLKELCRVLKDQGVLSFSDHHMEHEDILRGVTEGGHFCFSRKGKNTYTFKKR